jgi:hypothetical protein
VSFFKSFYESVLNAQTIAGVAHKIMGKKKGCSRLCDDI